MPKKKRQRRTFSAPEKIKMVLEVLKEEEPVAAIASKYEVYAPQLSAWKKEFIENAHLAFESDKKAEKEKIQLESKLEDAERALGQATLEADWLKKSASKWGSIDGIY